MPLKPKPQDTVERYRRLKKRNLAIALILIGFVVLFYVVTLVKGIPLISRPM
ncbi:MAG: hypothetical protein V4691_07170 [Pseudomonadota bacterium]